MKKFLTRALLLTGVAATLATDMMSSVAFANPAPIGNSFLEEYGTPQHAATKVAESLKIDPDGNAKIDPVACKKNAHSCATPNDLLDVVLNLSDQYSGLERYQGRDRLRKFVGYLNSLVIRAAPKGKYWMACLVPQGDNDFTVKLKCIKREYLPGELVIVNPQTKRVVYAGHCFNGVGPREDDCPTVSYYLKPGMEMHAAWLGSTELVADTCGPKLTRPGRTEPDKNLDSCPRDICDFSAPASDLGTTVRSFRVSIKAKEEGWYTLTLPLQVIKVTPPKTATLVSCSIFPDGTQTDSVYVQYQHYRYHRYYVGGKPSEDWDGIPAEWRVDASRPKLKI